MMHVSARRLQRTLGDMDLDDDRAWLDLDRLILCRPVVAPEDVARIKMKAEGQRCCDLVTDYAPLQKAMDTIAISFRGLFISVDDRSVRPNELPITFDTDPAGWLHREMEMDNVDPKVDALNRRTDESP
jgi:hypothetical protein